MRYLVAVVCSMVFLLAPGLAGADPVDGLVAFLAPLTATVIMPVESGVLIDKGSADRIAPGDVLAVVKEEKQLRHPQTGQVLDTLTEYGGYLVVTRVKANLSYCRPLGAAGPPAEGTRVRRFANLPVYFVDSTGDGFAVYRRLQKRLPHLQWQDYRAGSMPKLDPNRPTLLVRYAADRLTLLDQKQRILFLQRGAMQEAEPSATPAVAPAPAAPAPAAGTGDAWSIRRIPLSLPDEIEALQVSDLDRDGRDEILLAVDRGLQVGHLEDGQWRMQARYDSRGWRQVLDISTLDLDGDGRQEVIVSAVADNRAQARVLRYAGGRLQVITETPMLLRVFRPVQREPVLIGIDDGAFLESRPQFYRLKLADGRLVRTPCRFARVSQPYGVTTIADAAGVVWQVSLTDQDHLRVANDQGRTVWESADTFGGSNKGIRIPQPGARNTDDFETYFFRSRVERTARGTLLVAQHDGSGLFRNNPVYSNGRLVELAWNGATLDELSRSRPLGGMIVDFAPFTLPGDKPAVLAAVVYQKRSLFRKPSSGLVILVRKGESGR